MVGLRERLSEVEVESRGNRCMAGMLDAIVPLFRVGGFNWVKKSVVKD